MFAFPNAEASRRLRPGVSASVEFLVQVFRLQWFAAGFYRQEAGADIVQHVSKRQTFQLNALDTPCMP